jgi:hypothetical protein
VRRCHPVARPIVSRSATDSDACRDGGLECLVHSLHAGCGPGPLGIVLRIAVADRDHRDVVTARNGILQSVDPSLGRELGEVHEDVGAGGDRTNDACVEHDFASRIALLFGGLGVRSGTVSRAHHNDIGEGGRSAPKHVDEVGFESSRAVAAVRVAVRSAIERHDGDVLAPARQVGRVAIEFCDLRREESPGPWI